MDLDINEYLDIFVEEANEHLQDMNYLLLELENDHSNKELLNELFRIAHTLKGMAGTMGFEKISNLTHIMEDVLDGFRDDKIGINTHIVDVLFKAFDELEYSINSIAETGEEKTQNYENMINMLREILNEDEEDLLKSLYDSGDNSEINEYVLNIIEKASDEGLNSYKIRIKLEEDCMLKAARAFIIFNTVEKFAEIISSNPSVEDIEDEKFNLEFEITIITKYKEKDIEKEIVNISEVNEISIIPIKPNKKAKEKKSNSDVDKYKTKVSKKKPTKRVSKVGKTVRVDIDRLDNLMNLVSELIIIKTRMEDLSGSSNKEDMNEAIEYLERITTNLHDAVMKVRMVPIERVFNRFPRMVRDLSKELGKEINLVMSGEDTEVDRTVIDEIGDPLVHLVRNSIDHGIEKPDERIKMNKDKVGVVKLIAYPDGNNVVIEVEDDGKGINYEKVKEKAIKKGVISENSAENLSKDEIIQLMFSAGFSTTEEVSDISGRGVGLDVVKSKIESISGSIEVNTEENKGTRFTIRIPLTLAIIQALLIKVSDEIFAIPLSSISEINNINVKDIRKVQGQEVILYRGKTLPIIRLNEIMDIKDESERKEAKIVFVKKGDRQAGLMVDNLIGQQEIVIKPLGKYLSGIKYLAGATILGNGKISLILDVNSLF